MLGGVRGAPRMVALDEKSWQKWQKKIGRIAQHEADSDDEPAAEITICCPLEPRERASTGGKARASSVQDEAPKAGAAVVLKVQFLHPRCGLVHAGAQDDASATLEVSVKDLLMGAVEMSPSEDGGGCVSVDGERFQDGTGAVSKIRAAYIEHARANYGINTDGLLLVLDKKVRSFNTTCSVASAAPSLFRSCIGGSVRVVMRVQQSAAQAQPEAYEEGKYTNITMVDYFNMGLQPPFKVSDIVRRRQEQNTKLDVKAAAVRGLTATLRHDWFKCQVPPFLLQVWAGCISGDITEMGGEFEAPPPVGLRLSLGRAVNFDTR